MLLDITNERFKGLEKQGLVRAATDEEVAAAKEAIEHQNKMAPAPENKEA